MFKTNAYINLSSLGNEVAVLGTIGNFHNISFFHIHQKLLNLSPSYHLKAESFLKLNVINVLCNL